jgi:hypothetical protein
VPNQKSPGEALSADPYELGLELAVKPLNKKIAKRVPNAIAQILKLFRDQPGLG